MNEQYDAVIIGAGVIGACTAFELSGSCAIIRTYYSNFDSCALAYESWHYWSDWANYIDTQDEHGLIQYHNTGCLVVKAPHNQNLKIVCETMDRINCPYEHIAPEDIPSRLPGADTREFAPAKLIDDESFGQPTGDSVPGAVFFPNGGYVSDPKLSAHNAQKAAEAKGATFLFNTEVTGINRANGSVSGVTLSDGREIDAKVVINVGGPHSSIINKMAGVDDDMKISTRALRHEVAHVPSPAGVDFEKDGLVYSDTDIATYARPELGNNILIGSEDPECDSKEWVDDPDNFDTAFSQQWKTLVMRLAQRLPALGIPESAQGVVALYDVTEDWIPIYDKSSLPGYYMAIGTSGNQFKNAPVAGKMMASLIEACENGHDHDAEPLPFHLDNIGHDISMGTFSRNRAIKPSSSVAALLAAPCFTIWLAKAGKMSCLSSARN